MKTNKITLAIALFCFFLGIGSQTSLAQETKKDAPPSGSPSKTTGEPGTVYTSPVVSFLRLTKLTEPLKEEVRVEKVRKILEAIKNEKNKRVPDLRMDSQGGPLSTEYYEISGDLSGRKLTVQHIPSIVGKSIGNISFTWDEKDEKSGAIQNWFVSLFLDGLVETALDPAKDKLMVTSGGKVATGAKHRQFWQMQSDQILQELAEVLQVTGKLK